MVSRPAPHIDNSGLGYAPKIFTHPNKNADVAENLDYYEFSGRKIVIDRDLAYVKSVGSKTKTAPYSKEQLLKWAKEGYAAIQVFAEDGSPFGYCTFDGRITVYELQIESFGMEKVVDEKSGFTFLKLPGLKLKKGSALQTTDPAEQTNLIDTNRDQEPYMANAIFVGTKKFTVRGETYSPMELAKENIVAVTIKVPGTNDAEIYDLNGNLIARIDVSTVNDPTKTDVENEKANEQKVLDQIRNIYFNFPTPGSAAERGLLYFHPNGGKSKFSIEAYVPHASSFGFGLERQTGWIVSAPSGFTKTKE